MESVELKPAEQESKPTPKATSSSSSSSSPPTTQELAKMWEPKTRRQSIANQLKRKSNINIKILDFKPESGHLTSDSIF